MDLSFLEKANVGGLMLQIAQQVKVNRLQLNMSQEQLALKAGVSLGSIKRFESSGEISLKHLLKIAILFDATDPFLQLFSSPKYQNMEQLLASKTKSQNLRQRANGQLRKSRS